MSHCGQLTPYDTTDLSQHLAQVMACCLTAPSHYLNQCSHIIKGILWLSSESNFTSAPVSINQISLKITLLRLEPHLPGTNELSFPCGSRCPVAGDVEIHCHNETNTDYNRQMLHKKTCCATYCAQADFRHGVRCSRIVFCIILTWNFCLHTPSTTPVRWKMRPDSWNGLPAHRPCRKGSWNQ